MRQLTLIRHARACRTPGEDDFARPLSEEGREQALRLAHRVSEILSPPDLILSSGAERALSTAEIVAQALDYPPEEIQVVPEIYSGYDSTLINLLQGCRDQNRHLMLVGHNPGISQLVRFLSAEPLPDLPPCALVNLHLNITQWCELAEACATLRHQEQPDAPGDAPPNLHVVP